MDMFMDKLVQKFTPQETTKANTSADAEDLKRMRNRVAEYNECLDRLQALLEENGATKEGGEFIAKIDASLHKECIKVYRNMQAVVVEESGKIQELEEEVAVTTSKILKKTNTMLGLAIAAFSMSVVSFGVAIFVVLQLFGIKLF
ncbi:MAG: hypothetical protein IJB84_03235 [Lachnospiraceae bacterium]|nr:hypothetical protein [Lachnospiraceae bacterium]